MPQFPTNFPPELLSQLAAAGFKPPQQLQPMQAPGMQMSPMQPQGGMGMGEGMMGLGMGLNALGKSGNIFDAAGRTKGDADLGGYGASPVDPMGGNPNAIPSEVFNPTGAASGGGFGDWWARNNPFKGLF